MEDIILRLNSLYINKYNIYIYNINAIKIQRCWKRYNDLYLLKIIWCLNPFFEYNLKNTTNIIKLKKYNKIEKIFGNKMINQKNNNQWTTLLSENLFKQVIQKSGKKIWRPKKINNYKPDWETIDCIYEIKCRNWTTSGTIGDKVLGVPIKYSDIPRLYNKPLKIVCMAYQEYELYDSKKSIFKNNLSIEKQKIFNVFKELNIEFIRFSDILKLHQCSIVDFLN